VGAWTGLVDIADNALIVEASNATKASVMATLRDQGYYAVSNGTGITSSLLSTYSGSMGVAVADNAVLGKLTFGGIAVDASSILVGAEVLGDSDINGAVDLTDLSKVLNNFGLTTPNWTDGNFDNAATIDLTDLSDVLNNFGTWDVGPMLMVVGGTQRSVGTIDGLRALVASFDGTMTADDLAEARAYAATIPGYPQTFTASVQSAPEPAALGTLLAGGTLLLLRRRARSKP